MSGFIDFKAEEEEFEACEEEVDQEGQTDTATKNRSHAKERSFRKRFHNQGLDEADPHLVKRKKKRCERVMKEDKERAGTDMMAKDDGEVMKEPILLPNEEVASHQDQGENESRSEETPKKRFRTDHLDEEDLELIEENLGFRIKRKKKRFERVRRVDEDEDDEDDAKDMIAKEIFQGEEDEGEVMKEPITLSELDSDEENNEESDLDDFIVDNDGQPISKSKNKKIFSFFDVAVQEAQEIFGDDFNPEQLRSEEEDEHVLEKAEKQSETREKKSISDIYEPSEIESCYLTQKDKSIQSTDIPERFQLRSYPVTSAEDKELEEETIWIYRHAFSSSSISNQESADSESETQTNCSRLGPSAIIKIKEALDLMRNQHFEVPFIAFYRKEFVEPELDIGALWKVWQWDEKWNRLQHRKQSISRLFQDMQSYQQMPADPDSFFSDSFRSLDEADIARLNNVQTVEELSDMHNHFMFYYGREIPNIMCLKKNKGRTERDVVEEKSEPKWKLASRTDLYSICQRAGLEGLAKKFGLTPEQFGENLRDSYQRHETEQFPTEPLETAKDYICSQFPTVEDVLEGARYMVAMQIAREPLVRRVLRQAFRERAKLNIKPTKIGKKEVDESHVAYFFKYLKNKPVKELNGDEFLRICLAEDDGMLNVDVSIDFVGVEADAENPTYYSEIKQLYYRDEFSRQVQEWNIQRTLAVEKALNHFLYPQMAKELKSKLLSEAKENVVKLCCCRLFNWLKVAPYIPEEEHEHDQAKGTRVLGVAYSPIRDTPVFFVLVDEDGEVSNFLRLPFFLKKRAGSEEEKEKAAEEVKSLKKFLAENKPHVVAVAAENRFARTIKEDIKKIIDELDAKISFPQVAVELVDNDLATLYMITTSEEKEQAPLFRQALSLARKIQDPLSEYTHVCSSDENILCLRLHPLQNHVKEDLLAAVQHEFINRVNEVGVDLNRAMAHPHTQNLLQYVCGLGARKSSEIIKILTRNNSRLENRTQLVTLCQMGSKVFTNCAGFIKIDTASLRDFTDSPIEILDGSRIHPQTYDWARKMAIDALEYDESADDVNAAGAVEEILENPERLRDLDLDAFAEELERQGYGNKTKTLYDIRAELSYRYKDLREQYRTPSTEEIFYTLTKETPQTFYIGKLITSIVTGFAYRRPRPECHDKAIYNDATSQWQCPFCKQNNFPELSQVWNHFDCGLCPGQNTGILSKLDNGLQGFIPIKFLSDKVVKKPEDRVKVGMTVHCRIIKIKMEKFSVNLTTRTSDLQDQNKEWKLPKDSYYDYECEAEDIRKDKDQMEKQQKAPYLRRIIIHPSFRNISFSEAEKMMKDAEQGGLIVRPSSKAENHLTITWKVTDGIYQHIDVKETGKANSYSLGRTLWINNENFENLDEITARFIQPMASFARDLLGYKYFRDCNGGSKEKMEALLMEAKGNKPNFIPYFISASQALPGKFLLGYQPRGKPYFEFVTITPEGFRFRSHIFPTMNKLFCWFKENYQQRFFGAIPSNSSKMRTAKSQNATLGNRAGFPRAVTQSAIITPSATPNYNTPTQQTPGTPLHQESDARTPSDQPKSQRPHCSGTPSSSSRRQTPKSYSSTCMDWRTLAENWLKDKKEEGRNTTPRLSPSATMKGKLLSHAGDTTPLLDEKDQ